MKIYTMPVGTMGTNCYIAADGDVCAVIDPGFQAEKLISFLRGQKLETLAQGRLAAYVEEGASLLQYNHLDDGLYLTTHTVPQEKYFVRLNVHLDEMRSELDRAVREAVPDYVLVGWDELPAEFDRYQLIATDVGYDDSNRLNKMLYLYRRKSE